MVLLKLTSTLREQSDDFTIYFPHLQLGGDRDTEYEIALVSASMWYAWYNISAYYNNNQFNYNDGSTDRTVTIPDGLYTLQQILDIIVAGIQGFGGSASSQDADDSSTITITPNSFCSKLPDR